LFAIFWSRGFDVQFTSARIVQRLAWVSARGAFLATALVLGTISTREPLAYLAIVCLAALAFLLTSAPLLHYVYVLPALMAPFLGYSVFGVTPLMGLVFYLAAETLLSDTKQRPHSSFRIPGALLAIGLSICLLISGPKGVLLRDLILGALLYFVLLHRVDDPLIRPRVYLGLDALIILNSLVSIAQAAGAHIFPGFNPNVSQEIGGIVAFRPPGLFGNSLNSAQVMAMGFALAAPRILVRAERRRALLVGGFAICGLIVSLARIPILAVFVVLLYTSVSQFRTHKANRYFGMAVGLVMVLVVVAMQFRSSQQIGLLSQRVQVEGSTDVSARLQLWKATLAMARDNPGGVGLGRFAERIGAYRPGSLYTFQFDSRRLVTEGAESLYLTVLAEAGAVTLLGFLILLVMAIRRCVRARSIEGMSLGAFWVTVALIATTSFGLLNIQVGVLAWIGLALTSTLESPRVRGTDVVPGPL
jgi:hypothetical protein